MDASSRLSPQPDPSRNAYDTVARAIRWLRHHAFAQPSLADLSRAAGLSEFHLQRLFGEWAGVSPKRFLQFLTREHAKQALRASADVLAASFDAGLSGPGRLHDLLVACDGVTPGEVRSLGASLEIRYGAAATRFGEALIGVTSRGVCRWRFLDGGGIEAAEAELRGEWPRAARVRDDGAARQVAESVLSGEVRRRPLHLLVQGTNFQIQVWEALLRIPEGALVTYGRIAAALGVPDASRAVAGAVARNPIAYLIPCHRVIRETGALAGYRWGEERKAAMIAWEAGRAESASARCGAPVSHRNPS
jgi:AraC family transcriptional regulator, regulatory protein of adaptative response / methylated-DNA-[protein]-cysteine methyltransferase